MDGRIYAICLTSGVYESDFNLSKLVSQRKNLIFTAICNYKWKTKKGETGKGKKNGQKRSRSISWLWIQKHAAKKKQKAA